MTSSVQPAIRPDQLRALRLQLIEQRGFRIEQLRTLCVVRTRNSRSAREVATTLKAGARSALHDVEAALRRMDEGSYGRCTACGEALPIERLEVLPQVARCMPCQRAADLG